MYMLVVANGFIGKALTTGLDKLALIPPVGLPPALMSNLIIFGSYPPLSAKVAQALGLRDDVSIDKLVRHARAADSEQTGVTA